MDGWVLGSAVAAKTMKVRPEIALQKEMGKPTTELIKVLKAKILNHYYIMIWTIKSLRYYYFLHYCYLSLKHYYGLRHY